MKIIFHKNFYSVYTSDPAAAAGRMEAAIKPLKNNFDILEAAPAEPRDIEAVHSASHIAHVRQLGLYNMAALAAGGAVQAAVIGLKEPAFALIRPPGHHASQGSSWGFCYFNNMAVALAHLFRGGQIKTAAVLDFDLHFGDGTVDIFSGNSAVSVGNPDGSNRKTFLREVESFLQDQQVDIIGISAGFDYHEKDWGGLLMTEDYLVMGRMVKERALETGAGYFAILEGGYNHSVLGQNVLALIEGMIGA